MKNLLSEQIKHESEEIFKEIVRMHLHDYNLSMKCPLEKMLMEERNLSAEQTICCFRLMEQNHKEELIAMGYGSFSHFGGQGKKELPPPFRYTKYIPQPDTDI